MASAIDPFALFQAGDLAGAERAAKAALEHGDDPRLLHLAGLLACRRGDFATAIPRLQRALELAPASVELRGLLVRALIDDGRGAAALAIARTPAPGPAALPLWRMRVEAAAAAGAFPERTEAERHVDLMQTEAALAERPHDRALRLRRARLLGVFQRDAEAEQEYRRLITEDGRDAAAIEELGRLFDRSNRVKELAELLGAAEGAGVGDQLGFLKALLAWRRKALAEARDLLERTGPGADPVRHYALLAKVADAAGDWEAASAAAVAKNDAVPNRAQWLEQSARFRREMRGIAELLTPQWAAPLAAARPGPRAAPAFLLGFPRSGTTLLDTFLMGHPRVRVLEEQPLLGHVTAALGSFEPLSAMEPTEVEALRHTYFAHLADHVDPRFAGLVVDKNPVNTLGIPLIHLLFPDAKLIFVQRHPCDCVLSGLMQNFHPNPAMASFLAPSAAADFYDVTLDVWTRSRDLLPLTAHIVRYEDLVAAPAREVRRLADFLALEWSDDLLDHRASAQARGRVATASYDQVTEPIYQRSIGRWRHYRSLLGPALPQLLGWAERLGYPLD